MSKIYPATEPGAPNVWRFNTDASWYQEFYEWRSIMTDQDTEQIEDHSTFEREAKVLEKLSAANMHVHCIDESWYQLPKLTQVDPVPFHVGIDTTHYIMQEDKIVFTGNLISLAHFVMGLKDND